MSQDSEKLSAASHASSVTPMMKQYLEMKEQYPDTILFYRIGDFYEMFYDDAVTAAKVLDIVLTSRNKNDPNPVPLCGVPYHSAQPYLEKLVSKGYKVAICDQVEDPATAKGVVRREVTRVLTPGVAGLLETGGDLSPRSVHYLLAVHFGTKSWGLSLMEVSTGDFRVTEITPQWEVLREEISRLRPREILVSDQAYPEILTQKQKFPDEICVTRLPDWVWEEAYARKLLLDQFRVATLSGFQCEDIPQAVIAAGATLYYIKQTQKVARFDHLTSLKRFERKETMILGEETRENLNLNELIDHVDRTRTSLGRRKLADWFLSPLIHKSKIETRLDAVEELRKRKDLSMGLQSSLERVYDLERINGRLSLGSANARDLRALSESLIALKRLESPLSELSAPALKKIRDHWNSFEELSAEIASHVIEEPPFALKDGGLIRDGVNAELDGLRSLRQDAKSSIAAIEEREKKRTGIATLKVQYNRVFGYFIEVTASHLTKVPSDYIRKQTLANSERYITPELKDFEDKVMGADGRIKALEYEIFCGLREKALARVPELQAQAERVAELDVYLSLAHYARDSKGVRPVIEESGVIQIKAGRHPLVEKRLPAGSFVANDVRMDSSLERLMMITGPNMAGKSTIIRQTGVIALMAQVGAFVPAASATIGIVDRIFTRVGAADRLARGESTFMVEMCETAHILHHATDKSLVLLDEIGRGTSTFDGVSIAWAVAEHLHDKIRARTMFATHYHELIDLAVLCPGIKNYNVLIKEEGEEVTFLYRLVPGGMSHSYGIHVARLAGLPPAVVDRAKEVLKNLEQGEFEPSGSPTISKKRKKNEGQFGLF